MKVLLFCLSLFVVGACRAASDALYQIKDFVTIDSGKMPHQFAIEVANVHTVLACFIADATHVPERFAQQVIKRMIECSSQNNNISRSLFNTPMECATDAVDEVYHNHDRRSLITGIDGLVGDEPSCVLLLKMSATGFDWVATKNIWYTRLPDREAYKPEILATCTDGSVLDRMPHPLAINFLDSVLHINHDVIEGYFNERMEECFVL